LPLLYHLLSLFATSFVSVLTPRPLDPPLFPYTTLFRSKGIPDVRVVLYRDEPAMAMLRLPTRASNGRANLHQGGIGAGIDASWPDRKSTRLNSSHQIISYAVFCLKKKKKSENRQIYGTT